MITLAKYLEENPQNETILGDALREHLVKKREAFEIVLAAIPGMTPDDFGIPQIEAMLLDIEGPDLELAERDAVAVEEDI